MTAEDFNTDGDFDAAYKRYHQTVLSWMHDVVQDVEIASDLTEEVFITAFKKHRQFDPSKGTLKMWLYGIARNVLRVFESRSKQ